MPIAKVKFVNNPEILKIVENKLNPNPINEFRGEYVDRDLEEAIEKLLEDPQVGKILRAPTFKQLVTYGQEMDIDKAVADELEKHGLAEIVGFEKEQNGELATGEAINSNSDEALGQTQEMEDRSEEKKDERANREPFERQNGYTNPEIDSLNAQIEEIDKKYSHDLPDDEKKKIIEEEERLSHEINEKVGKMYYLTPERMLENLQNANGGRLFKTLFNTPDKRYAVERAYLTCSDPNMLTNPDFLTNRISQFLPEGENVQGLKGVHKLMLANTYVGYHVEENSPDAQIENNVDSDVVNPAMVEFPAFVSDMPESLKNDIRENGYKLIKDAIQDTILNNSAYTAICVISDSDKLAQDALGELEQNAGSDAKGLGTKAYIKTLGSQFEQEAKKDLSDNFDFSVTFDSDDLENDSVRADIAKLLKQMDDKDQKNVLDNAINNVEIDIVIRDTSDVEKAKSIADSFRDVTTQININYAIDAEDTMVHNNLQNEIDSIDSSSSSNIKFYEDVSTEQDMAVDRAVGNAIMTGANIMLASVVISEIQSFTAENVINTFIERVASRESIDVESEHPEFYRMLDGYENNDVAVEDIARQVNDSNNDLTYEEAIYRLSMEADISMEMAEDLLIDAGARASEEYEFGPNRDQSNQN